MKLKPRPQYLSKLVAAQDNSLIKVITGMRRCGKSSLLTLFRQHLLQQGIAEDHIIMMNLESFQYSSFTFEDLHNAIADRMQQDDHYYLLLDEVQLVDKWERAVNALHTDADVDITITGSNAYLLSSQLATLLSGRYMEINVFPLSFAEFMAYADLTNLYLAHRIHKTPGTIFMIPGKYIYYFTNNDFPVISAGCCIPISSISVGAMSARHPPSRSLYAGSAFTRMNGTGFVV